MVAVGEDGIQAHGTVEVAIGSAHVAEVVFRDSAPEEVPVVGGVQSGQDVEILVGGGVGVAPLMYLGRKIKEMGGEPTFLLGARSKKELLLIDEYEKIGRVFITTEDGSEGEKGFVTNHSILSKETFDMISTCGPKPMMMAVANYATKSGTDCEVSLENKMACGVGACLCCVEDTLDGHVCVCKDGPVINIKKLKWQN